MGANPLIEEVHVSAFVEPGEPILVIPASHWRALVWLHAELAWKYAVHRHSTGNEFHDTREAFIPHWIRE